MSNGSMNGRIQTTIGAYSFADESAARKGNDGEAFDLSLYLAERAEKLGKTGPVKSETVRALSFNVGDRRVFSVYKNFSPTGNSNIEFKLLYVGQHCYIWTPVSSANTYPLDYINSSYASMAAAEFDSKFPLMQEAFGTHANGAYGDGRVNLLFYNINSSSTLGFYDTDDYDNNGLPCLHLDTYNPGVYYYNGSSWASVTTAALASLSAPTGVVVSLVNSKPRVIWNSVSNAASYEVYRAIKGGSYSLVGTVTGTSFSDTGLNASGTYYYKVVAKSGSVQSPMSAYASIKFTAISGAASVNEAA